VYSILIKPTLDLLGFCREDHRRTYSLRDVPLLYEGLLFESAADLRDVVRIEEDGWIVFEYDGVRHLIAWIPAVQRDQLYGPRTEYIIGGRVISKELDMSKFVHGRRWKECYKPSES
jgi:hypothetical protein